MNTGPRIVFVNRFYWPEEPATAQLLGDLAEGLAAAGLNVLVLTSAPHGLDCPRVEVRGGVLIRRVRSPRFGGSNPVARVLDWALFTLGALWRVGREVGAGDTLVLLTDPPLLAAIAAPLASLRRARVVHWVQDVYPDLAGVLNDTKGLGGWRALRNRAWRRAAACVTLGRDMARLLKDQGVEPSSVHIIPNWAPRGLGPATANEISALRDQWGLHVKFAVIYSGNLGRVHDLEPVIAVAERLRDEPDIVFLFVGDGAQRTALEAMVKHRGLAQVRFLPHQPRGRLAASLGAADVHLVTLRSGCEQLVFPSKLYGITAVGRPVLFIGPPDCDLAHQVAQAGMGGSFARDDVSGIAQALLAWRANPDILATMGRNSAAFAQASGGPAFAIDAWLALLRDPKH